MQASTGPYPHEPRDGSRRGHIPQLSISDDSHHVTESIGHMYEDNYDRRDSRRLSYVTSPSSETIPSPPGPESGPRPSSTAHLQPLPLRTSSMGNNGRRNGQVRSPVDDDSPDRDGSSGSGSGQLSPALSRAASTTNANSLPLNDIDYHSDPATVAQELSNLAALRRMSMDVGAADPDLPLFGSGVEMPSLAPSPNADEDDASRLFWVPARLHPGIAPNEFKSFLEKKSEQIKRRSAELSSAEPGKTLQTPASGGGLQRKKSTLSRQVDSSPGGSRGSGVLLDSVLEESLNKPGPTTDFAEADVPILPPAPPGHSLRRSTRTTYRKGSFKAGERVGPSRRLPKQSDPNSETSPHSSENAPILGLTRVSTDPTDGIPSHTRAAARARSLANDRGSLGREFSRNQADAAPASQQKSSAQSNGQITASTPSPSAEAPKQPQPYLSERKASQDPPPTQPPQTPLPPQPPSARATKRLGFVKTSSKEPSISDIAAQPSPLPGNHTRTDSLSVIPTLTDEKKSDPKKSKSKKEPEGSRKSSWHWGRSTADKKKDEDSKKAKSKIVKAADKLHDDTRLDVLQSSIDGGAKRRESLTFDRSEIRLDDDDRRKDSAKKSSGGDGKKEKESGIFSFFSGGKRRHGADKKPPRNQSPEPQLRQMRPDVDYNWTRFSILEERAIYRMAHIKLANPRRALYSQVLLTNFMYSYLAKVQQMHPQTPAAASPAQDRQQKQQQQQQQQQQQKDQPEEYTQYQRYQELQDQAQYDDSYGDYEQDDGGGGSAQSHGTYGGGHQQQYGGYPNDQFIDDDDDDDDMW